MSAGGSVEIRSSSCCSIRETVSVENAGRLRSGHKNVIPFSANRSAKNVAFDDCGEDAKPCR